MLDGHKTEAASRDSADTITLLNEIDWRPFTRDFEPPLDPRLAFAAWNSAVQCWLALASVCLRGESLFQPAHGWLRKAAKVPPKLRYRFFTFKELGDIYFLVLLDLCSASEGERIARFASFLNAVNETNLNPSLRKIFDPLHQTFSDGTDRGYAAAQKRLDRTRSFLLDQGFSHIRIDLVTGGVRLFPIPKDIDPTASLTFNHQPGNEVTNESTHARWEELFGKEDFWEIALDSRVNDFHRNVLKQSNSHTMNRQVNPNAPKHGIIVMPRVFEILMNVGLIP